jgi:glycosyltransferase involved in cell wall biosynthesis/peptidoglycan/xylan/chitin deacetylase (PgdA/CDA1 family)
MTSPGTSRTASSPPRFSVIVPTHGRRETVARSVAALDRQTLRDFEAIVVVDGDVDGTAPALRALKPKFELEVIEQENRGVAAARLAGAARATGEILLFLDDDMEPDPELLLEHDKSHREGADLVLGDLPLHPDSPQNLLSWGVCYWAKSRRERLTARGAELDFEDLITGQMSVSREAFEQTGGFDLRFTGSGLEGHRVTDASGDLDFGYRVMNAGFRAVFNPRAISYQYYDVDPADYLRRAFDIGASEQELFAKHPEQASRLAEAPAFHTRKSRWLLGPLVAAPGFLVKPLREAVATLVRGGRRGDRMRRLFFGFRTLEYLRGARHARRRMSASAVVVLAYHAVADLADDPLRRWGVPPRSFAEQLDGLKAAGWTFIDLDTFLRGMDGHEPLPRRAAFVTFDDAYVDVLTEGAPILEQRGIPAVAFAVAGLVGGVNEWARPGARPQALLDADGLRSLASNGIAVGSHAKTHRRLPEVPEAELDHELRDSADALESLNLPRPTVLAYPYGEWDAGVARAAHEAGYAAAFAIHPGIADRTSNRYALPRIEVFDSDTSRTLRLKIATVGWPKRIRDRLLRAAGARP